MRRSSPVPALIVTLGVLAVSASPAAGANRWLTKDTWVIAHQGGEDEFPSNTTYAFKQAIRAGADMLELDVGVTKDNEVVVLHDTSVDRTTNGRGLVSELTLAQIRRLDNAYWFSGGSAAYKRGLRRSAYRFRGIATGKRKPPKGFKRSDFAVTTLKEVLRAFPKTPINIEIKGRTKAETIDEYVKNAEVVATLLKRTARRDLVVVSFKDEAIERFRTLVPEIGTAPGLNGSAGYLLAGALLPGGTVALQLPVTYRLGGVLIEVASPVFIAKTHGDGFAWHAWFGDEDRDAPGTWNLLIDRCVDGIMTARPKALAKAIKARPRPAGCPR